MKLPASRSFEVSARGPAAWLAVCSALLVAGCTQAANQPVSVPVQTPTAVSQIKLPLMSYLSTEADTAFVLRAAYQYQVKCAKRFGFTVRPSEVDMAAIRAEFNIPRRYGIINADEVARYGYDPAPVGVENDDDVVKDNTTPRRPEDEVMTGLADDGSASRVKDVDGKPLPKGGCGREGVDKVSGDVPVDYDALPRQLLSDAYNSMKNDTRYQQVEKEWADCMAESGYRFSHPYEAGDSVGGEDKDVQMQMAQLDLKCRHKVNLAGRAMAIDIEYQNRMIAENEGQLRGALEGKRKLLENAKKAFQ